MSFLSRLCQWEIGRRNNNVSCTTERELLEKGFRYTGVYTTPKDEYQVYSNLNERILTQSASEEGQLWVIERCKRLSG